MRKFSLHWQILVAMVFGAVLGIVLNMYASHRGTKEAPEVIELEKQGKTLLVYDSPNWIEFAVKDKKDNKTTRYIVGAHGQEAEKLKADGSIVYSSIESFRSKSPEAYALFHNNATSLSRQISEWSQQIGSLFLRLLKMVSIPLIITSLVTGVLGLGTAEHLGRMFKRTLTYYLSTSMIAITTGIAVVNLIQPGVGSNMLIPTDDNSALLTSSKTLGEVLYEQVLTLIPENPFAAVAEGNFLSIISFSIMFSIAGCAVGGKPLQTLHQLSESFFEVMMKLTLWIIHLVPVGVFFLMLYATSAQGAGIFLQLGWYMATVILALSLHAFVFLPLIVYFWGKRNPFQYMQQLSPALLTAFSSASSGAALPLTITNAEQRAGISNRVTSFVLPLGSTINMDGTALYEAVAVIFIAQMYGMELTLAQQVVISITALLASVGAAGIPQAGLVMMVIILQAVGLPTESQGIILAVDRVLDMCRTSVNVWGDACGCTIVQRYEDEMELPETDPPPIPAEE